MKACGWQSARACKGGEWRMGGIMKQRKIYCPVNFLIAGPDEPLVHVPQER